jgi:23S rRNA pseudouridine2605 synthase
MPRKSNKKAEAEAAKPAEAKGSLEIVEITDPEPQPKSIAPDAVKSKPAKRKTAPKKAAAKKAPVRKAAERVAKPSAGAEPEAGPAEAAAQVADTFEQAMEPNSAAEVHAPEIEEHLEPAVTAADSEDAEESDEEFVPAPRPHAKLERLQKILAQAGVASRRHAETLITEGRVQVNGKIVTELGSKADRNRDHIRVDGKLLQGAERLRYFVLNKPRGYVTTVSDPEHRPTVMEFFKKMNERLYPVGRLDYLSEGLLIVTNDGELANKLTKAASAVEKTYLVKVSGQPTEEQLETLRAGISIDRGKPGEGRVRTSPARIRQVRVGENPWYEVVLIEGRNRELRKMFDEIGHFVEKIRRVGYGPLILDQEPGNLRELDEQELKMLRLAAEGKWKPKRIKSTAMLPKEAGRTYDPAATKTRPGKPFLPVRSRPASAEGTGQDRPRTQDRGFAPRGDDRGPRRDTGRTFGHPPAGGDRRPFTKPPADRGEVRSFAKPPFNRGEGGGFAKPPVNRGTGGSFAKPPSNRGTGGGFSKPPMNRGESRGFAKPSVDRGGDRRSFSRPPASGAGQRPFRERPADGGTDKPRFDRPAFPSRPRPAAGGAGFEERKPFKPRSDRPASGPRPVGGQGADRRFGPRPGKPAAGGFGGDRRPPQGAGRSFSPKPEGRTGGKPSFPPRREGGAAFRGTARPAAGGRAGFTSTGVPRPGGPRPPSKGGAGRTGSQGQGRTGGGARPGGGRSSGGPRPGNNGASRPGFKGKPAGRGGKPGGKRG